MPQTYFFVVNNQVINIIDTPGLNDTRGLDQDKTNLKNVLKYIACFKHLNTICFLLRANQDRLTPSFKYCMVELFRNLDEGACDNVTFCLTNAKSSNYKPGQTFGLLEEFLKNEKTLKRVKLTADKTVYCVDSEPVVYLAERLCNVEHDEDDEDMVKISWKRSVQTTTKFLTYVNSLEVHAVAKTVSLNNARRMIEVMADPLIAVVKTNAANIVSVEDAEKKMATNKVQHRSDGTVEVIYETVRFDNYSSSSIICGAAGCASVVDGLTVYGKACCIGCYISGWMPLRFCSELRSGTCKQCCHSSGFHTLESNIPRIERKTEYIQIEMLRKKSEELKNEQNQILDTCSTLTNFVKRNGLCGVESTDGIIISQLNKAIEEVQRGTDEKSKQTVQQLRGIKKQLEDKVAAGNCSDASGVEPLVRNLYALPNYGQTFRERSNQIQMSERPKGGAKEIILKTIAKSFSEMFRTKNE